MEVVPVASTHRGAVRGSHTHIYADTPPRAAQTHPRAPVGCGCVNGCTCTGQRRRGRLAQETQWATGGHVDTFRSIPSMQPTGEGSSEVWKDRAEPLTHQDRLQC